MALPKPKGIQLEVLDLKPIGHNVVLGTAGSGKTTLAIYRAIGLANYSPKDNILLITFNTTLVKYLEAIVGSELPPNIHVRNYHKFARGYLASRYLSIDYDILWKDCVNETVEYLKIAREGIVQGVLDIGNGILEKLCCFDKKVNGAGNVSAVIAIYLFSKNAADPYIGLMETINLKNTDTDTLGSMVGALFGALHGDSWIPIELRGVQDYKVFEQLIVWLLEGKEIFDEKQQYRLFSCEQVSKLTIGEMIEVLPFGKLELIEIRNEKTFSRNMYAVTFVCRTGYGQTIFATKVGRNSQEDRQKSADQISEPSFDLRINKAVIIELGTIFNNVRSTCDFVEIVTSLMKLIEQRESLSKEFIDYYKEKWKKYRITKKQMEMAYKLLMK